MTEMLKHEKSLMSPSMRQNRGAQIELSLMGAESASKRARVRYSYLQQLAESRKTLFRTVREHCIKESVFALMKEKGGAQERL